MLEPQERCDDGTVTGTVAAEQVSSGFPDFNGCFWLIRLLQFGLESGDLNAEENSCMSHVPAWTEDVSD